MQPKNNDLHVRMMVIIKNLSLLLEPIKELYRGIKTNTLPWPLCTSWMVAWVMIFFLKIDFYLISKTRFSPLYPYYPWVYKIYVFSISTLGFWFWAWGQVKKRNEKLKTLTECFKNAGLVSKIGRIPQFISDFALDPMTRKMRLTNAGFPVTSFRDQAKHIESQLGIFIDEIKENRELRVVELIYSHYPMATEVKFQPEMAKRSYEFPVGKTRASLITANLRNTPHLLVAGQTGGGKSTFLRQLIVNLFLTHDRSKFLLIDLKGGLEFSIFENRKRFVVVPSVQTAIDQLQKMNKLLDERMAFLKSNNCKDIDSYFLLDQKEKTKINLDRQVIVVDEAAEMFLAGHHAKSVDIQSARAILSRIARQGRAVGINMIVATQRPDSKSLDPQVKANLIGVVCFQMMNDASSIAVLGNGRATDLPKVAGRAIWKNGIDMIEVQTPFLSIDEAEKLLGEPDNKPTQNEPADNGPKLPASNNDSSNNQSQKSDHYDDPNQTE